jgi:hypothetical protein
MSNQNFSLVFTKLFTSGLLKGLTYVEFLSFPNLESRTSWLEGIQKKVKANKLNWQFTGDTLFYENVTATIALEDYKNWAH